METKDIFAQSAMLAAKVPDFQKCNLKAHQPKHKSFALYPKEQ